MCCLIFVEWVWVQVYESLEMRVSHRVVTLHPGGLLVAIASAAMICLDWWTVEA